MEELREQDIVIYQPEVPNEGRSIEENAKERAVVRGICDSKGVLVKCLDNGVVTRINSEQVQFVCSGGSD